MKIQKLSLQSGSPIAGKLKIILCVLLIFFAQLDMARAAEGEINLFVSPQIFELNAEKGETIKNKIKIYNRGKNPAALEAIADDFGAGDESGTINFGNISKLSAGSEKVEDISKWIKIENSNFILGPGEQENINFTISVPGDVSDGGKYAVIFFQPRKSSSPSEVDSVEVLPKIGVLLLLKVGSYEKGSVGGDMTVVEFNIPENFHINKLEDAILDFTGLFLKAKAEEKSAFSIVETGELSFTLRIKNNDIYHIKPGGKLAIVSGNGKKLGETEISKTTILPGKIRRIPVEFKPQNLAWFQKYLPGPVFDFVARKFVWGRYEAKLSLSTETGALTEKSLYFWVFPWKTAIMLLLLFLVVILMRRRFVLVGKMLFIKNKS